MKNFKIWMEAFETPHDFLLNPANKNTTFESLITQFQNENGVVDRGKYGTVLISPKWPYVIKIFPGDEYYVRFARFAYRNPHPSFPKIYGPPQKIVPFFKRTKEWTQIYVTRIEKLFPVQDQQMIKLIIDNHFMGINFFYDIKSGKGEENREYTKTITDFKARREGRPEKIVKVKAYQELFDMFEKYPQTRSLMEAFFIISQSNLKGALDIHSRNIMQRQNGQLVFIDPLWVGSNPYIDEYLAKQANMDMDQEEPKYDVIGGEYPKRKRFKKISKWVDPDVPF